VAETSYAPCGDLSLAYQVFGDGPVELVWAAPFISHVELFFAMPEFKAFFDQLSTFCRVLSGPLSNAVDSHRLQHHLIPPIMEIVGR
jgi:hypothetical protein